MCQKNKRVRRTILEIKKEVKDDITLSVYLHYTEMDG
jgi:hypothetical protein